MLLAISVSFNKVIWNLFAKKKKQNRIPVKTAKIISVCNATICNVSVCNFSDNFLSSKIANPYLHQFSRGSYGIRHCNRRQFSFTRSLEKVGQTRTSTILSSISICKQAFTTHFGNICCTNYSGN